MNFTWDSNVVEFVFENEINIFCKQFWDSKHDLSQVFSQCPHNLSTKPTPAHISSNLFHLTLLLLHPPHNKSNLASSARWSRSQALIMLIWWQPLDHLWRLFACGLSAWLWDPARKPSLHWHSVFVSNSWSNSLVNANLKNFFSIRCHEAILSGVLAARRRCPHAGRVLHTWVERFLSFSN